MAAVQTARIPALPQHQVKSAPFHFRTDLAAGQCVVRSDSGALACQVMVAVHIPTTSMAFVLQTRAAVTVQED